MKLFALLYILLLAPTRFAAAQSNAIPILAVVATNGITVAVHSPLEKFYTNAPIIISEWQVVQQAVFKQIYQVTTVENQVRTNVVFSGFVTNILTTNKVSHAQLPNWPVPPITQKP